MKKRLLSALLALALVFVLLPTTALAEVVSDYFDCDISILGNYWKFEKDSNNEYLPVYYKSEASSFEDSTVAPENNYLEIRKTGEKEITITVHGDVNITATGISIDTIAASKSVIINGDGHLTVKYTWTKSGQNYSAIDVSTLTVEGVALSAEASMGPALFATYGIHIKDGAMVEAKAGYFEAVCEGTTNKPGGITVDNATLVATATGGGNRSAIKTYGDIAFTNAKVTATNKSSENAAIQAKTYEGKLNYLYVSGTSTITATNQSTSTDTMARAIGATIKNNNTSEKIEVGSSKVDAGKTWYTNAKQVTITSPALERDSDVLIAGKNAVVGQWTNIPAAATGTGSYYYDADKKELTLKDVNITHSDGAIVQFMAGAPYIIKLEGTNSIKDVSSFIRVPEDAYESLDGITRAIDIKGDLTVTNGSLTATSTSNNVPTVQVGGNASFTGSTVTITNNSTTQGKSGKNSYEVSTGLYVGGTLDIKNAAKVTSTVIGGNAIYAKGDITISGDSTEVKATNDAYKFSAISTNKTVNISDNSTVKAENLKKHQGDPTGETDPSTGKTYNACPAITGKIANKNTQNNLHIAGFTTSNAGSQNPTEETPLNLDIAPGSVEPYIHHYNVTITRGDKVTRTNSPVVIAGTTLLNDTFYTINGSTVAEGTESNYNAFYNSTTKTLKLNNAQISHSFAHEYGGGQDGAIIFKEFENYFIELSGENTISSTNTYAINCHRPDRTLTIKNAAEAENAKLTLTSNWMVICSIGGLNIQSDVTMVNTKRADYLMYVNGTFSYTGYNAYASTEASGSPLEVYNPQNYSTYKYLRVTKENLAPTTPTIYTVTITAGDNMKRESGALTQEVTKGAAITEVKFMAASGHYFPADYVSKMNLPAGLTAEIRENSWYLIISGTPTSDVTINLPAASVRPTITVSMPTPVAGNTPATASNITLTYSDINKSISKNLTISNVVWQSYVPNGDGSITPGEALSSGDKFEAGKTYFVRITHEYVAGDYDIVPAAGITLDYTESGSTDMMLLFYTTGAPCNHEYTNDWLANGNTHWHECKLCRAHAGEVAHTFGDWITDTPATDTTDGSKHRICSVCQYRENATIPKTGTGEIVPPTPDNPGTIVIIRPAEEEKPAQQPNPSTGANDLVGLAVAAAVAAALGSAALLRKHD